MGLIDSKKAIKALTHWETEATDEEIIYTINNLPTVEAIPKDQYEARLKADMVAMLTDLHLKMEELGDDLYPTEDWDYGYKSGVEDMIQLLDERIDKLKGESDAQEQKKE